MMDTDYIKQEEKETVFSENVKREKRGKKTSRKLSAYFRESIAKSSSDLQTYKQKCLSILPKDIQYDDCGTFFPSVVIKMTRNTKNYQFIDVQARLGFFWFKRITILTINKVSPLHDHQFYSGGSFSTVYSFKYQGIPLACKCFERPKTFAEDSELNILKNAIEEYCILKLASHLKVGPRVHQTMGYDIIVYFDCIQFSMQMCEQYSPKQHKKQDIKTDLLQNLARLHCLHIIHHDIKFDNICYSRQFNKFVFIDFGFGRVIPEQVGFLTLTGYKGSLSHCSSQMVELFHSNQEKEIDLYYNDMNALKVALLEFQDRSEGMEITQEAQKGIDKLQESPYINHHFQMYQLKYLLYQLEFDQLYRHSSLEEQKIEELLNFVPTIYYSHRLKYAFDWLLSKLGCRQFDKMQNNIFRLNYSNKNTIEDDQQNQETESETFRMLRSINNKHSIDYVLFKYEKQADYLLKKYQDVDFLIKVPFDQYCHFVAKAIQINSNNARLQELNNICEIAIKSRSFHLEFNQKSTFPETQGKYLMQVSLILFKKSIQNKLIGNYYDIFLWTINNVIILKLISYEQITEYYESLLKVHLRFEEKVNAFLKFNTALAWIPMMASNWSQYATFSNKINALISKHFPTLIKDLTQQHTKIMQFVLQRQQTSKQRKKLQSTQSSFSSKSLFNQIKMWETYKRIFNYQYSEENQEMLQSYQCEVQFSDYFICQYHHSMILVYYLMKKEFVTLSKCLEKLESVLILSQNYRSSFITLIKSMFKLRKGNYQGIQIFLKEVQQLKTNGNPAISIFVKRQLEYIRYKNTDKFKGCSLNSRNAIFHLELQAIYNVFRYKNRPDFQGRFLYAINRVIKESILRQEYFLHFGIDMNNNNFLFVLEHEYRQLVKEISILREKESPQTINYYIFLVLFLLVALLVNKQKHYPALSLSNHLITVFPSIKSQTLTKKDILQFVFRHVLEPISKKNPSIKAKNCHLFFQYHDIITYYHSEQNYFDNISIFIDVLQLLYRFKKQDIVRLINNLSKKLQKHENKFNSDRYFDAIQLIFYRNRLSQAFIQINSQIHKDLDLRNNHFNIIFLYHIFTMLYKLRQVKWTRLISFRMFQAIQQANVHIKEKLLQNLYIMEIFNTIKDISERKKAKLIENFIRVNKKKEICITKLELIKLFLRKQSIKLLKRPANIQKYRSLKRILGCFVNSIESNSKSWRSKLLCSFNNFQISYKKSK